MTEINEENQIKTRMDKALIAFQSDLNSLRAGRASINMLDPILLEGTVDSSGFVENSLIINNWAHLGSIKLQLSECNPFNTVSKSCDWVPNSLQVLCGF